MWIISPDKNTLINSNNIYSFVKDYDQIKRIDNPNVVIIQPLIKITGNNGNINFISFEKHDIRDEYFDNIIKGLEQEACK